MTNSDWAVAGAAAAVLIFLLWGQMPRPGVDLAHHYALVSLLMDEGTRSGRIVGLGEMQVYPPLSHYMAATIGFFTGSGFTAMLAIAIGAVAVVYAVLLGLLRSVSMIAALIAAAAMGVLIAARVWLVPGTEIVGNFFFPQLVGYALALLLLAALAGGQYRRREGSLLDLGVLAAANVIAFLHLLPALQLLGAYALVLLVGFADERTRSAAIRLAVFSGLALTLLIHPSFAVMTSISANEGGLGFGFAMTPPVRALFFAVGSVSSGAAMIAFRRKKGAGLFLGAFGCAAALLGFAQWAVFALTGYGSSYAVGKHIAVTVTFGLVNASALIGVWLEKRISALLARAPAVVGSVAIGIVAVLLPLAMIDPHWTSNADLLAFQAFARSNAPQGGPGIALSSRLHPASNYLISIGDLRLPRDQRARAVLTGKELPPGIHIVFLHSGDEKKIPGCDDTLAEEGEFRTVRCVSG